MTIQQHRRFTLLPCIFLCFFVASTAAFSSPAGKSTDSFKWFTDIFSNQATKEESNNKSNSSIRRNQLKLDLLTKCRSKTTGDVDAKRKDLESIIESLVEIRPIDATASSPIFQKNWLLEWTTEKEINFFSDVGLAADVITQTIDGGVLSSDIPLPGNSNFGVTGALTIPEIDGVRTNFEFTSAKLDLWGGKISWTLPPVGKGWFDTVYLDDELRIDFNSRDDILICRAE
uniref:Plastid lipid-associated protein/fibrillin conserved domain-containing protein n=1 Tax=Eucampia antarctica TaxID=49252 RepID=A0A7S2W764_9STRA|mmetsp:Transcript_22356/g.21489  ORF Transcript_22356/g.21489 Transcript_22356/m.21489 type:complete len:230 (+) Transcript_22356:37-726(+)|eukprot:CAMPEP_0197837964 /NCGR_PEP_ID=MMETSP1437-20131217/33937_1 /TAXON_ID=49252 ORGANISM="Eucampia antarctica, Strain CCMP1452" /NCGR_SAMPLE_ID=MMETSP1437 /ASSEMBLY_ACC=CAM_ASM_001096 /LENGTH=229 /DNA_ID=CAMNT_0043445457 /DNA_START=33 /DNA_END=722 /DNA_ORIENTATION=-